MKKVAARCVDLTKAHVNTKKAGKVGSVECFSSGRKASVENLLLATIEVTNNNDKSVISI